MTFECQCCGDCCSTMGEIISIREEIRPFEFRIMFTDGEERIVTVDEDKRSTFVHREDGEKKSLACPFLRPRGALQRICTVHDSRPGLCRMYLCSRILILGRDGARVGRIAQGTRSLTTTDGALLELWNSSICTIADDDLREQYAVELFTKAGYRVIR